ncbi:LOW QUALITY PROTEIN: myosin phosphatase Rho-interacting protein [Aplochiton taeniatus]
MSSKDNACRKFQANIFNKSKCQNCFKPRESHLLNDDDLSQAKPIYGGWLLLAPEGTNFDNPLHRSRKWQRRFFILYEHGLLRYALDEMPSTLPQGTINMNQCSDVVDGESRTGQKNSLCVLTPDTEHFIRAECREIINGWQETLTVYPRTNKQNQKKKRKVEPAPHQEPGPAKVPLTSGAGGGSIPCLPSSIASAERVPASHSSLWQEEGRWGRAASMPCSRSTSCLSQLAQGHPGSSSSSSSSTPDDTNSVSSGRKVRVESGYFSLEKTKSESAASPTQPPLHLPLSTSSSLGTPQLRYSSSEFDLHTSPDPLPSPGTLLSPGYSTISSSQSSLDSEPSSTAPSWDGRVPGGTAGAGRTGRSGSEYAALADVPRARRLSHCEAFRSEKKRQELRARTRSPGREEVARLFGEERSPPSPPTPVLPPCPPPVTADYRFLPFHLSAAREHTLTQQLQVQQRSQVLGRFSEGEGAELMDTSPSTEPSSSSVSVQRQGRSERRYLSHKQDMSLDAVRERSVPDVSGSALANFRRAKSLDRRVTESSVTPDLLNFKKGWMTKLYGDGVWKKHWFVLTDQSLKYYRDSIAEEAADMDGEIDLSTCYDVTEFPVQRNYGFQILSKEGAWTLSAMTSGIRRNWIQAVMKNVRPAAGPDVTRSLPEEIHPRLVLEPCPQPCPALTGPGSENARAEVHTQRPGTGAPPPASEQRKSKVRERRREGRSKTYDWSEFRPPPTEAPKRERADTVDLSSASLSSTTPSSSATSSPASSPVSPASSAQTSSSSLSAPPLPGAPDAAETRPGSRREDRRRGPQRQSVTPTPALDGSSRPEPGTPEAQGRGGMEVDRPASRHPVASGERGDRTSDAKVEIEQRWHQVETTPLREEKQVPIATPTAGSGNPDRLPPQELAALLNKELGQTQKELARMQEQNHLLQGQLEDAQGREQSAREGYVLQTATTPSSSPHRPPWQGRQKLSQDLQGELEAQKLKQDQAEQQVQTLRRSYTEAKDALGRHESDVQALQAKLASAMAEILVSEQAVARMRSQLKLEQERSKEQEEEWGRSEATLRAQLKDSEDRLREVEASLLEKSQVLRHLERQQALQRDHLREVQRLQDRLQEVTARLCATEQAQALKEECLQNELLCQQESHERERQSLTRRLAEAEVGQGEVEERLKEAEQQVKLCGRAPAGAEGKDEALRHQELDMVETLRESVHILEEEKGHLTCRCQELLNQIAEADGDVVKLRRRLETEETDYYSLEHSYEKASEEFQNISRVLREKEEEIRQTKDMYEKLVERKDQDLNEALVKMAALGSSLEETEQRLQARGELLCHIAPNEPCGAEKELQTKLGVAENRIAELEQQLRALQLGYADLRMEPQRAEAFKPPNVSEEIHKSSASLLGNTVSSLTEPLQSDTGPQGPTSDEGEESQAKRPRIRFSSIQCQKYMTSEGLDTCQVDSSSEGLDTCQVDSSSEGLDTCQVDSSSSHPGQDASQDINPSEGTSSSSCTFQYCSDPEKFISIIHALETKLMATEEKLKDLTQKLEDQRAVLSVSLPKGDHEELDARLQPEEAVSSVATCQISAASSQYDKALTCVEVSKEKVKAILCGPGEGNVDLQMQSLSEIQSELVSATMYIKQGEITLKEDLPEARPQETQQSLNIKDGDGETIRLFAKTLSFEAMVLNKMAFLIHSRKSDLLQGLSEICQETERVKQSDEDCLAVVYANVLVRKLMLESAFWTELGKSQPQSEMLQGERGDNLSLDADATVIFKTCLKGELTYSAQNLKHFYEEKLKVLQRELTQAYGYLQQREIALTDIFKASNRPDLENVIQQFSNDFAFSCEGSVTGISPPELDPYMEQIEMEEAKMLAEEIVDRHLAVEEPPCTVGSSEFMQVGQKNLVSELKKQAAVLHRFSQEIESVGDPSGLAKMIRTLEGHQANHRFTSSSLCMREALIQAQVAYVACKLRGDHERDLTQCRQAGQNMDALVQEHALNVKAIQERYEASLRDQSLGFTQAADLLQEENRTLKAEVSQRAEQLSEQRERLALLEERFGKEAEELRQRHRLELSRAAQGQASMELALMEATADSQRKLEVLLVDMDTMEERHEGHVKELEAQLQGRLQELQRVHKEEIQRLHAHYMEALSRVPEGEEGLTERTKNTEVSDSPPTETTWPMEEEEEEEEGKMGSELDTVVVLKDRIQELETQMDTMKEELESKHLDGDVASLREKYQRDFDSLKATCERGFAAMEETHHKVIEDIQRQHQREISKLLEERERLLDEETAATIAAIEAMKNAHKEEMEKNQRPPISGLNSDIDELRMQYDEELQSIHRELEVLSEQYSQKCLENAHLAQALEAERQALRQCQRENQELNAHNQELNNRLTTEITRMRSCFSGETALSPLTQGKDLYELEVLLRIKESEIQYLKQEIHSLKDELQSALRDKKYTTDKYKDIYTELSIVKAKADCDITKLKEKLIVATEALGERTGDGTVAPGYDIMKSKSDPDFLKQERSTLTKKIRSVRSKSLKEGLTVQERMKLFEAKDHKKI